jgi:hypothetical protein
MPGSKMAQRAPGRDQAATQSQWRDGMNKHGDELRNILI